VTLVFKYLPGQRPAVSTVLLKSLLSSAKMANTAVVAHDFVTLCVNLE
jgi:hypothetical protein